MTMAGAGSAPWPVEGTDPQPAAGRTATLRAAGSAAPALRTAESAARRAPRSQRAALGPTRSADVQRSTPAPVRVVRPSRPGPEERQRARVGTRQLQAGARVSRQKARANLPVARAARR